MASPLQVRPFEVKDFSGGITDFYISGPPNKYQAADNLFIDENKKLFSRPGAQIQDADHPRIPANAQVKDMVYFELMQFHNNAKNIYYRNSGWQTLTGPSSNPVFHVGASSNYMSSAEWNKHLFVTNDELPHVQKIYKDAGGTWRVRELGLPAIDLAGAIVLANDLKSKFNAHIADASAHTTAADSENAVTSADATDYDTLITLVTELLTDYDAHEGDAELESAWLYHAAQEATDHSLASTTAPTTLTECIIRLTDLKTKLNAHDADDTAHGTDSSHQVSIDYKPNVSAGAAGSNSYIYAFHYVYEYMIGSVSFRESGPVYTVELASAEAPNSSAVSITQIPTISNGTTRNFDTATIKVEIFRTINGGTTFYFVDSVTNGTTTYSDSKADTTIDDNRTIYTSGGVLDNTTPPQCKYLLQANEVTFFLHTREAGATKPNGFTMSKPAQPYAAPFREEVEDEIVGGGVVGRFPIIFCKSRIYRVEGSYDISGRGTVRKIEISRTVGCVSERSIVQARLGLYFAGNDGFYWTDGFNVIKISEDLPETYKTLIQTEAMAAKIYGAYDSLRDRVIWSCQSNTSSSDNDVLFVAHLRYGVKPDTPFTTWTGNWSATSLLFRDNKIIIGDRRGYTLDFDDDHLADHEIDTTKSVSNWNTMAIIYDHRSCAFDFGTTSIRKWVSKIAVSANNESSLSLGIFSNNDNSGTFSEVKEVKYQGNIAWGDLRVAWGDPEIRWNYLPVIDAWRRFPARGLRCSYKQIRLTNSYTLIDSSSNSETATVDASAKTVTLDNYSWMSDAENYFISFGDDNFEDEFLVTNRTDNVLTYSDNNDETASGPDKAWRLRGYEKNQVLNLLAYVIYYAPLSVTMDKYEASEE